MGARPGRHLQPLQSHPVQLVTATAPAELIGAADLPSLWNQQPREGMQLHWDGKYRSVDERNLSAALGAGVTPTTVDHDHIKRVRDWIWTLPPPKYPYAIDATLADSGQAIYARLCAECHSFGGTRTGTVVDIGDIGTDLSVSTPTPTSSRQIKPLSSRSPGIGLRISARRTATPIIHWMAFGLVRLTSTMARCQRSGIRCRARRRGLGSSAAATMSTTKKRSGSSPIRQKPNAPARRTIPPSPAIGMRATSMGRNSPTRKNEP